MSDSFNVAAFSSPSTTILYLFEEFYRPHKIPMAAPSTIRQYHASISNFEKYLGRPALVTDLRDELVAKVAHWLMEVRKRTPDTARKFQDNIVAIWNSAARKRIVETFPEVAMVRPPSRAPIAWGPEELVKLFHALDQETGTIGGIPAAIWWHTLHAVIWDSAERISAILSVRPDDLHLSTRWLNVRGEYRKGKTGDNPVKLHRDTCAALRKMLTFAPPGATRLFPFPSDIGTLYNRYKTILRHAGLPHDRYHKFHCLRRSAASYFEAAGLDATKLLGHSDRRVTLKYLDPRIVQKVFASDVLFRPERAREEEPDEVEYRPVEKIAPEDLIAPTSPVVALVRPPKPLNMEAWDA